MKQGMKSPSPVRGSPVRGLSMISQMNQQQGANGEPRLSHKSGVTNVSTGSSGSKAPMPEDFGAPKKPLNGYKLFCQTVEDRVNRACGMDNKAARNSMFKELYDAQTELKKLEWVELARAAHDVYADAMYKWKQSKGFGDFSSAKVKEGKKKEDARSKKRAREFLNMPKAPLSSFLQYGADYRENLRRQNKLPKDMAGQTQLMKEISAGWRELDRASKDQYDEQRKKAMQEHKIAMDAWKQTDAGRTYLQELENNQENQAQKQMEAKVEQAKIIMQAQLEKNEIAEAKAREEELEAKKAEPTQMQRLDEWLGGIRESRGIVEEMPQNVGNPGNKKRSAMSSQSSESMEAPAAPPMKKKMKAQ